MSFRVEDSRVTRSRALALEAAIRVFLNAGYHGTTLEHVAAEAGLAKRTIYNLFLDKDTLFRQTVLSAMAIAERFTATVTSELRVACPAAQDLPDIAVRLAEATLLGPALALRRLVIMESIHFPDLVADYRAGAPEAVMDAFTNVFTRMSAAGTLRPCDPRLAAEHFAFLIMGADLDRGTFTGNQPPARRIRERARSGAAVFLAAYTLP